MLISSEAAVVGGEHLLGCFPPAGDFFSAVHTSPEIAAVNAVYIYIPLALTAVSIIFIYLYKLDKEYDSIISDLDKRKAKQ
ncbi:hypothetical protein [Trichococcus ilyis]|uniref:Uncharacterized protein n=1 Tax=Trichococcus ilyis TaxID=640938 RepID=A0A143YK76_9LACT|nr:hypothetical protein [Trichococcus ilyis]CZQ90996.1 Hypothetical protein TR210_916 [Trichococcus ilyis]SEI72875.1 hypothetical protein SAMN05216375_10346 [Trichococcus ilyis]